MTATSDHSLGSVSTRTTFGVGGLAVVAALAVTAFVWPELPEEMIVNWDADGSANGTASRTVGALLLPGLAAVLLVVLELLPRIDPLGKNFESFRGYYNGFVLLMTAFLVGVHGAVLAVNLGYEFALTTVILGFVGVVLIYTALLLRVAEPNWFVGVRTPWTLSSEAVWRQTHSVTAVLMGLVGVATVVLSVADLFVDTGELQFLVLTGGSVLIAAFAFVYSYYLYAKLDRPDDQPSTR